MIISEMYFNWLYLLVGKETRAHGCYWRLMRFLFTKEFYYKVRNDDNRAKDGMDLRMKFARYYGYDVSKISAQLDGPCRMLEMLVALSTRINDELMWDPDNGDQTEFWFWTIIENAGFDLKAFKDEYFGADSIINCHKIVDRILNRQYEKNGVGGLFPLKNPPRDQRKVEIWYQLNSWLNENFPLDPDKIG